MQNPRRPNKEEIGSLIEKEFRGIIVKIIQNLENKMEAWINRLEAWIEKMQDMFRNNLEKLKNKQ